MDTVENKLQKMVEGQIERRGVVDPLVLEAMRRIKRHIFVPIQQQDFAYEDGPLPIGHQQTISQPYIVACMTEALEIGPDSKVLEIGTGSGYQTAVLAETVREVFTIEVISSLSHSAQIILNELGYKNIHFKHGDGYNGWPESGPYDAVIVTAAPTGIPEKPLEQLKVGKKMVVPVGAYHQELQVLEKTEEGYSKKVLFPVRFVPMVHKRT